MKSFFMKKDFVITTADTPPTASEMPEQPKQQPSQVGNVIGWIVLALGLGFAAGAVWYIFLR